jgi:hypothetical protein
MARVGAGYVRDFGIGCSSLLVCKILSLAGGPRQRGTAELPLAVAEQRRRIHSPTKSSFDALVFPLAAAAATRHTNAQAFPEIPALFGIGRGRRQLSVDDSRHATEMVTIG